MRKAIVYRNGQQAGTLTEQNNNCYEFRYDDDWFYNSDMPAISLTLPKTQQIYQSEYLFPFFFNLLSEGVNKKLQCQQLKIDETDYFGLLLATASWDTPGAITVKGEKS